LDAVLITHGDNAHYSLPTCGNQIAGQRPASADVFRGRAGVLSGAADPVASRVFLVSFVVSFA
jgi:hypothetical protein